MEIVKNFSKKSNIECLIVEPNLKKLPNEISGCLKTNLNESKKSDIHVLLVSHKEFEKKLPKKGFDS